MKRFIKMLTACVAFFTVILLIGGIVISSGLPDNYMLTPGCTSNIKSYVKLQAMPMSAIKQIEIDGENKPLKGNYNANIMLLGVIPIKKVTVQQIDDIKVVPCGTPFGVKIFTRGVIIVGISDIKTGEGLKNPAKEAGLLSGDIILSINKCEINSNEELKKIVEDSNGATLDAEVMRNNTKYEAHINPVRSVSDDSYKLGVWVRDSSAGIGTLTFFDPETKSFGGLGHGICDVDTGEILPLSHGDIIQASINGILKGVRGNPGELKGYFVDHESIGYLTQNTYSGVYGVLNNKISNAEAVPVAMKQQIKRGKAQFITTICGTNPEYFDIDIQSINYSESSPSKNMIIKITDDSLLRKTGGIIQGMSGSPIIQNGMLVGAITHVFVNDPQKGYAIIAENMISQLNNAVDTEYKNVS